jgi:hypothetical protein
MIKILNVKQDFLNHLDLELGIYLDFGICNLEFISGRPIKRYG